MAVDGGERSDRAANIRISFVNKTGEPYFPPPNIWTTNFTENVEGRNESRFILEAFDPKNAEVINEADKYNIFYFIDGKLVQRSHLQLIIFSFLSLFFYFYLSPP